MTDNPCPPGYIKSPVTGRCVPNPPTVKRIGESAKRRDDEGEELRG